MTRVHRAGYACKARARLLSGKDSCQLGLKPFIQTIVSRTRAPFSHRGSAITTRFDLDSVNTCHRAEKAVRVTYLHRYAVPFILFSGSSVVHRPVYLTTTS